MKRTLKYPVKVKKKAQSTNHTVHTVYSFPQYCNITISLLDFHFSPILIVIQETLSLDMRMGLDQLSYNMKNAINNAVNEILLSTTLPKNYIND